MKIPEKKELKNLYLLSEKIEKQTKVGGKKKGRKPFYPIKIFIFAYLLKILTKASYRELEKFLKHVFKVLKINLPKAPDHTTLQRRIEALGDELKDIIKREIENFKKC